jgi:hypothetical protein
VSVRIAGIRMCGKPTITKYNKQVQRNKKLYLTAFALFKNRRAKGYQKNMNGMVGAKLFHVSEF